MRDGARNLTQIRGERTALQQERANLEAVGTEQEAQLLELNATVNQQAVEIERLRGLLAQGTALPAPPRPARDGQASFRREGTTGSQGTAVDQGSKKMLTPEVEKLTSATPEHFIHFRDSMEDKISTETAYFRGDDRMIIRHIQGRLSTEIANMMRPYVTMQGYTAKKFMERLGKSCGMDNAARKARIELTKILQKPDEAIDTYHARIASLWNIANTSEEERIESLRTTVNRGLAFSIVANNYDTVDELLDALRSIEARQTEIRAVHSRNKDKPAGTSSNNNNNNRRPPAPADNTDRRTTNPNAALTPTATKPQGWTGPWFEPEANPKSLAGDFQARLKLS